MKTTAVQFQIFKLAVQDLSRGSWRRQRRPHSPVKTPRFCRTFLKSLADLDENILDLLDALPKGYSMMEILWEASGGEVGIRGPSLGAPQKDHLLGIPHPKVLTEEEPIRGIDPPAFKFVYHRCRARSGYDTRAGIMRVCAWMYLFWFNFVWYYTQRQLGNYEITGNRHSGERRNPVLIQQLNAWPPAFAGVMCCAFIGDGVYKMVSTEL